MVYVGIDGSTTSTGIAVFKNKNLIFYECIAPKDKDWEQRLSVMAMRIDAILKAYKPSCIIMEDVPLKKGSLTLKKLSAVRGMMIAVCAFNKIRLEIDSVSDWRRNAGFFDGTRDGLKRDAMKQKAINEVKRIFDIEVNDDIAEAILIAYRTKYPKV